MLTTSSYRKNKQTNKQNKLFSYDSKTQQVFLRTFGEKIINFFLGGGEGSQLWSLCYEDKLSTNRGTSTVFSLNQANCSLEQLLSNGRHWLMFFYLTCIMTSLMSLSKPFLIYFLVFVAAKITTRPGQVGACNGYILEGDELQTFLNDRHDLKSSQISGQWSDFNA